MKAAPINLHPERCLDARHCRAECSSCVDLCPVGAIRMDDRQVSFNQNVCTGCGLCLAACPMEVFTTPDWTERTVLDFIGTVKDHRAELMCVKHPEYDSREPRPGLVKIRACLAAMSPGLLFEAGRLKDIDLRMDACGHCDHKGALGQIEASAALAESWLSAAGGKKHVSLISEVPQGKDAKSGSRLFRFRKSVEADEICLDRRDFLVGFARQGSSLFAAVLERSLSKTTWPDGKRSSQSFKQLHVPSWREALSRVYPKGVALPDRAAVWARIRVNKACTGCAVCERYCPAGALKLRVEDDRLRLTFLPGLCADCGLCALSCPVEAVTRGYAAEPAPFREQVILAAPLTLCPRCRTPVLGSGEALCYWCASEPPVESLIEQARQHLLAPQDENPRKPEKN